MTDSGAVASASLRRGSVEWRNTLRDRERILRVHSQSFFTTEDTEKNIDLMKPLILCALRLKGSDPNGTKLSE